jgi:hypothetical protein
VGQKLLSRRALLYGALACRDRLLKIRSARERLPEAMREKWENLPNSDCWPARRRGVLKRAECWSYGRRDGITEAKLCFGERGRLAWWAWSETGELREGDFGLG